MYYKMLKLSTLLSIILGTTRLQAQESFVTTGGEATGSGGAVSYSAGQIAYQTCMGSNGSVEEGVQQPYEIAVLTGIEDAKGINLKVVAYPNPTADNLILEIKDSEFSTFSVQLFDMNGNFIQNIKHTGKQTRIVMNHLAPSSYFLKVFQEEHELKTFKIIKTK
jgi:hypothetical protein